MPTDQFTLNKRKKMFQRTKTFKSKLEWAKKILYIYEEIEQLPSCIDWFKTQLDIEKKKKEKADDKTIGVILWILGVCLVSIDLSLPFETNCQSISFEKSMLYLKSALLYIQRFLGPDSEPERLIHCYLSTCYQHCSSNTRDHYSSLHHTIRSLPPRLPPYTLQKDDIDILDARLNITRKMTNVYTLMAMSYYAIGHYQETRKIIFKLMLTSIAYGYDLFKNWHRVGLINGIASFRVMEYGIAMFLFVDAVNARKQNKSLCEEVVDGYAWLALTNHRLNKPDVALKNYKMSIKYLDKKSHVPQKKSDLKEQEQTYDIYGIIPIKFDKPMLLDGMAACYYDLGQHDKVVQVLEEAFAIRNSLLEAKMYDKNLVSLAGAYYRLGKLTKANEMIEKFFQFRGISFDGNDEEMIKKIAADLKCGHIREDVDIFKELSLKHSSTPMIVKKEVKVVCNSVQIGRHLLLTLEDREN
jgi:tetratricopeptide (TPR) repeat protein